MQDLVAGKYEVVRTQGKASNALVESLILVPTPVLISYNQMNYCTCKHIDIYIT